MHSFLWTVLFIYPLAAVITDGIAHPLLEAETEEIEYDEYLSIILQQQENQEQQQRNKRQIYHCNLVPLNVTVFNDEGCQAHIPLYGCAGRCLSTEIPHHFSSRYSYISIAAMQAGVSDMQTRG